MIDERRYGILVCGYLLACLILGGASAAGVLVNLILQLFALPLGLFAVWRLSDGAFDTQQKIAVVIVGGVVLLPLLQLVPLDPAIWANMPGREMIVDGFSSLGMDLPWLPLSMTPRQTFASWLALLPAVVLALAVLTMEDDQRPWIGWTILSSALLSAVLGTVQFAATFPYFYEITNVGSAVGFFSNRNHLATLLLVAIPIVTLQFPGLVAQRVEAEGVRGRQFFAAGLIAFLLLGLLAAGSRAGLGLAIPVVLSTIALRMRSKRGESPIRIIGVAFIVGLVMVTLIAFGPLMSRMALRTGTLAEDDTRLLATPLTAEAGWNAFPFGTGMGSFDAVFRVAGGEANLGTNFINHAHNDYVELWLTGGLPAVLLLGLFFYWFASTARLNWSARSINPGPVPRVAAVGIAIILVHSIVDYPLRTAAMSSVFAVFCALQLRPVRRIAGQIGYADTRPTQMMRVDGPAIDNPA